MKSEGFLGKIISWIKKSTIAKNSFVYSVDFSLQIAVQAAYLFFLSRALGPGNFGIFAGLSAISIIGSTLVGVGSDHILIKNVSRDNSKFAENLGNCLVSTALTLPIIFAICYFISVYVAGQYVVSISAIIAILVADLLFTRLLFLAKACFVAIEKSKPQLFINIISTLIKLGAAVAAVSMTKNLTFDEWAFWYCASTGLSAVIAMTIVLVKIGSPRLSFMKGEVFLGLMFCLEFASLAALRDVDKPIIVSVLGAEAAGAYSVAFRIVDAASTPVRALLYATYTRYFKHSGESNEKGVEFGLKVLPFAIGFASLVSLCILIFSGTVPFFIGARYEPSVSIIRWLFLYPVFLSLMGVSADIIRAIGLQKIKVLIMLVAAPALVVACWIASTYFGLAAAAMARNIVMAIVVIVSWLVIKNYKTKSV